MAPEDDPADDVQPTREEWEEFMDGLKGKYGEIATTGKQLHPGEPVFVLRATDPLAPAAVDQYAVQCALAGCSEEHVAACHEHARRIERWQEQNPGLVKKLPD